MSIFLYGCLTVTIIESIHALGTFENVTRTLTAEKWPTKSDFQMYVEDNFDFIDIMTIDELIYMLQIVSSDETVKELPGFDKERILLSMHLTGLRNAKEKGGDIQPKERKGIEESLNKIMRARQEFLK